MMGFLMNFALFRMNHVGLVFRSCDPGAIMGKCDFYQFAQGILMY